MARVAAICVAFATLSTCGAAAASSPCDGESAAANGLCYETLDELCDASVAVQLIQVGKAKAGRAVGARAGALTTEVSEVEVASSGLEVEESKKSQVADDDVEFEDVEQIPGLDNIRGWLPGIAGAASNAITNAAAEQLVQTLNSTLSSIGEQADGLMAQCVGYRDTALQHIAEADATLQARATVLEGQVNATIGQFLPEWIRITNMFNTTVAVITTALDLAGQQAMASTIQDALSVAFASADSVRASLARAPEAIANLHDKSVSKIEASLHDLNRTLEAGLEQANAFARSLDEAFGGTLDTASNALANAVPGADSAQLRSTFGGLQTIEGAIGQKLLASLRTLVSGIGQAAAETQELLPPPEARVQQSGGARARALLALAITVAASLAAL